MAIQQTLNKPLRLRVVEEVEDITLLAVAQLTVEV
jgi:hypothetical protein